MADIHDCAVIATAGIAIDQKVTATLGPHMAQSHGCQLPNFGRRHASQFAPPFVFRQEPRRAVSERCVRYLARTPRTKQCNDGRNRYMFGGATLEGGIDGKRRSANARTCRGGL